MFWNVGTAALLTAPTAAIFYPPLAVPRWEAHTPLCRVPVVQRNMACIAILHQPWRSGVKADARVHLIAPARELDLEGYGAFVRPFATDAGAEEIYKA